MGPEGGLGWAQSCLSGEPSLQAPCRLPDASLSDFSAALSVPPILRPLSATRVVILPGPEVREGEPASLTCEDARAPSAAVYVWYKNSRWLAEGSAASLQFQAVAPGDTGTYACQAGRERGARKSPPASLQVLCE